MTARITVAADAGDAAPAAKIASNAVARALQVPDFAALYPCAIEVESVDSKESLAA
jgi:hypothetical protein